MIWPVKVGQGEWEAEHEDQFGSLVLNSLCQRHEVLVHSESSRCLIRSEGWKTFEQFRDVVVIEAVDFHQVLKKRVDDIGH